MENGGEGGFAAEVWGHDRVYPDDSFMFACHLFGYLDLARRLSPGQVVLDLACGEGYGAAVIARAGATCVALDVTPDLLGDSARRYRDPMFVAGDALLLPFADATFDAVGALQVIEHLVETDRFLHEMSRVLKPDGFAYLATPNVDRLPRLARKEFNPQHLRDFVPSELRQELSKRFDHVELFGQELDRELPRTQELLSAAQEEWDLMPRIERIEILVRRLPGPLRVRLRRALMKVSGIAAWPVPRAERARAEIRAEDFGLGTPAENSGNTIALATRPKPI